MAFQANENGISCLATQVTRESYQTISQQPWIEARTGKIQTTYHIPNTNCSCTLHTRSCFSPKFTDLSYVAGLPVVVSSQSSQIIYYAIGLPVAASSNINDTFCDYHDCKFASAKLAPLLRWFLAMVLGDFLFGIHSLSKTVNS